MTTLITANAQRSTLEPFFKHLMMLYKLLYVGAGLTLYRGALSCLWRQIEPQLIALLPSALADCPLNNSLKERIKM